MEFSRKNEDVLIYRKRISPREGKGFILNELFALPQLLEVSFGVRVHFLLKPTSRSTENQLILFIMRAFSFFLKNTCDISPFSVLLHNPRTETFPIGRHFETNGKGGFPELFERINYLFASL